MQAGHSRKESDDFSKLFLGTDSENLGLSGDSLAMDLALTEATLSFHQPKSGFTSFREFFFRNSERIRVEARRLPVTGLMKVYVHPLASVVILLAAILIPVGLGCYVFHRDYVKRGELLVIDKSLESFEIPEHISSQREDMISVASKFSKEVKHQPNALSRPKRSPHRPTSKSGPNYQKKAAWTLELVYLATGDDDLNIFTKERLETIHQIEQSLMDQEGFTDYCWKWEVAKIDPFLKDGCTPPISLVDFFFPSVAQEMRIYDGRGMDDSGAKHNLTEESIKESLQLLLTKPFTYWFVDGSFSKDNQKSRFLRAELKFGYPLKSGGSKRTQTKAFKKYLVKYVEGLKELSTK